MKTHLNTHNIVLKLGFITILSKQTPIFLTKHIKPIKTHLKTHKIMPNIGFNNKFKSVT